MTDDRITEGPGQPVRDLPGDVPLPEGARDDGGLVTIPATVAIAQFTYKVAQDIREGRRVKAEELLAPAVLEAWTSAKGHHVRVRITNGTVHGVYVEGVEVDDPKRAAFSLEPTKKHSGMHTTEIRPPFLIPPGESQEIQVILKQLPPVRLGSEPFGTLAITVTVAGLAEKPKELKVGFAIRPGETPE